MADGSVLNTDRELYREHTELTDTVGSYYENSVHVTEWGTIGIQVGGSVITLPVEKWHQAASEYLERYRQEIINNG